MYTVKLHTEKLLWLRPVVSDIISSTDILTYEDVLLEPHIVWCHNFSNRTLFLVGRITYIQTILIQNWIIPKIRRKIWDRLRYEFRYYHIHILMSYILDLISICFWLTPRRSSHIIVWDNHTYSDIVCMFSTTNLKVEGTQNEIVSELLA